MELFIFFLGVINLLSIIYFWYRIHKLNKEKKEVLGTILIEDQNSLYIEMKDQISMAKIWNSDYVIFEVQRNKKTLN